MSHASTLTTPAPGTWLRLSDVDWQTYSRLLRAFAERPGIRLTYDRGELEIMAPLYAHDSDDRFVNHLVLALAEELGLPLLYGGSTTMRRRLKRRGIEPAECYWIANAHRMRGVRKLDLRRDPPPDLAIEVDVTHSSLDHLAIFAALKVPEVWRLEGDFLTFHVLEDTHYVEATTSRSFPQVGPSDLLAFLQRFRQADDVNPIIRDFRTWIREKNRTQR
jgi:Uma2 family endonuclease